MSEVTNIQSIMQSIQKLSEAEQSVLAEHVLKLLATPSGVKEHSCSELVDNRNHEKPDCPHCHAKGAMGWVVKHGFDKGQQRYYCKSCGKHFLATTNTAVAARGKMPKPGESLFNSRLPGPACGSVARNVAWLTKRPLLGDTRCLMPL